MERPTGVTIIALLVIIGAILAILTGVFDLGLFGNALVRTDDNAFLTPTVAGATLLIVGIIQLIVGFGLWNLASWAWVVAVIVTVVRLIADVLLFFQGRHTEAIIGGVIAIIILWYLFRDEVRQAFGR